MPIFSFFLSFFYAKGRITKKFMYLFLSFSFYISGPMYQPIPPDTSEKFLNPVFNWQLRIECKVTLGFIAGLSFFQLAFIKRDERVIPGLVFISWSY